MRARQTNLGLRQPSAVGIANPQTRPQGSPPRATRLGGQLAALLLLLGAVGPDSARVAAADAPQLSLPNRPFGVDIETYQAFTDGFFDVAIGPQLIGLYLLNQSSAPLSNAHVQVSPPEGSGIVVVDPVTHFDRLPPGMPVLALFPADFSGSSPNRHTLTVHVVADGFEGTVARDLFVVRSEHDPLKVNRWTMYADVGHITTEAFSAYGGHNLGSLAVMTSFRQTVEYNTPFPGQIGPEPFTGPGDILWKKVGLAAGLFGCAGWAAGEIMQACGWEKTGKTVTTVGQIVAAAGGITVSADVKDFFKRGQEHTLPGPGELTVREEAQAQAQFLDEPVVGTPYRASVAWNYWRTTRDALGQTNVYTFSMVDMVTNLHFTSSRTVSANASLRTGEELVVSARLFGPEPLLADRAYVVATLYPADDLELKNLLRALVLRDDGLLGDEAAGDGLYTGVTPAAGLPQGVPLAGYVFGYDVNNTAQDDLPAAQDTGGLLVSAPTMVGCTIQPDFYVTVQPGEPGLWFAGLQHTPLGQATLVIDAGQLQVDNLGPTGQDGVEVSLGDPEGHTLLLPLDPGTVPVGATLVSEQRGPGEELHASLAISRTANGFELGVDFSPIGSASYTALIYDGSRLVAVQSSLAGPQVALQPPGPVDLKCKCVWWPTWAWSWKLTPTAGPAHTPVRIPFLLLANGQTVEGTAVELVPDVLPEEVWPAGRLTIRAVNLPMFRIADEALRVSGVDHRAVGQAHLMALNPQHLTVANLGTNGLDGVCLEDLPAHVVDWESHVAGLGWANDPANPIQDGAWLEVTARGTVNGLPDQIVSMVHHQDVGDHVQTQVELGALAPGPVSAVYRLSDGTTLVETNLPPGGWETVSWLQKVSLSWRWGLPPRIIDVDWGWDVPWALRSPSGRELEARSVEVQASPVLPFDGYSSIALTASGIPQFSLMAQTWTRRPPDARLEAPVLDRPNGLFQFTVPTAAGFLYRVESTTSLTPPIQWTPCLTFSGDGGPITVSLPLVPGGGEFFQLLAASSLPVVEVGCGETNVVYKNLSERAVTVTIQVTDNCTPSDSVLEVVDEKDKVAKSTTIPDNGTLAVSLTVQKNNRIRVGCRGTEGKCFYTIVSAQPH